MRHRIASRGVAASLRPRAPEHAGWGFRPRGAWRASKFATLGAALLLAGCASLAPPHERPVAPVAPAYPGSSAEPAPAGAQAADIAWQEFFADPRLQRLIELSLRNNRDLRIAVLSIEQARALYGIQRADRLPTVNAAANATRQPLGAGGDVSSLYTAGLAVTAFELDLFGRVRNLSEAALARYFATEEARKATQISLISAVANLHLALLADDALLELTRRTLETRLESLRLTQLRFEGGVVSELDFRQAQSLVESARATLAQQQRQRALDENALVLVVGQPLPADLPAADGLAGLAAASLGPELPAGLPSALLVNRPDIRQAEELLRAANANIGAARAAFFPRITLTGSAGVASDKLSGLFNNGVAAWSFIPQIVLPIFDYGRNRTGLEVAQVDRDIAVAQYERTVQIAFREVADALAGRATLGEQVRALEAQSQAERRRFELSDLRYRAGAASYLDLLDAQRSLFAAQQAALQTRLVQLQNQVTLYSVLGGGWQEPQEPLAAN